MRQHHLADRHARLARPQAGERIAEIAARHDERRALAVGPPDAQARRGVIHALRQQASEVDAVGRGQQRARAQLPIEERLFHQALAVIESAPNRQRPDVAAPAGELAFLGRGHQSLGVQHRNLDSRALMEGRRHGAPRVSGSRDQNGERPLAAPAQTRETGREEAGAEILDRRGRTVEQLEHRESALPRQSHQRGGEVERFGGERGQQRRERIAGHERCQQPHGDARQVERALELRRREPRPADGHVQPAVGRQALENRGAEAGGGSLAPRAHKERC